MKVAGSKPAATRPARRAAPPVAAPRSIYGIGVDLVRIERMQKLIDKHGNKILLRLLAPRELREVRARSNQARALAMCWAAKEAFVKALGTGFDGIGWKEVGVIREANGRPVLIVDRKMKARIKALGVAATHVSLSDDGGFVCAYVILER
ncbi:MAG: holo-ACP synthase [Solimonas sp.]